MSRLTFDIKRDAPLDKISSKQQIEKTLVKMFNWNKQTANAVDNSYSQKGKQKLPQSS